MIFEGHRILEDLDVSWITQVFAPFKFVYARCLFFFSILKYIDGDGCSVERTIIDPSIQMTYHGAPADPLYSSAMTRCSIGSRGSILNYMSCSDRHPFTWVVHLPKKIASLRQRSALVLNGL